MGLLPEREPRKNPYENTTDASPLNIERKEDVIPVPTQFKAQVTDDQGNPIVSTPQTAKVDLVIPEVNKGSLEAKIKDGNVEDSSVWSAGYWLRIFKKALYFGWKVVFDAKQAV